MEKQRHPINWLRSAYIVAGVIFVTLLGGLVQILDIADHINYGLVKSLTSHPDGPSLHGQYLFPKNWLAIFIIFLALMLIFPATTLLRYFTEKDAQAENSLIGLQQDFDDVIRYASNIIEYMYPVDIEIGRCNIRSVHIIHDIKENGDTFVDATYVIEATTDPAHFWCYWIEADQESNSVTLFRELKIDIADLNTQRRLDWLPVVNTEKYKKIAIFFPELKPGQEKQIRISYFWPGYMRKLIQLGATNFHVNLVSPTPDLKARLRIEWIFSEQMGAVNCRMAGRQSHSASLQEEKRTRSSVWIYDDPEAPTNSTCSVEFVKAK